MAGWQQVARDWAKIALENDTFAEALRARRDELATASLQAGGLDSVTQATKNAISMGKAVGLSGPDTLAALTKAVAWLDLGVIPSQSRGFARF